MRGYLSPGTDGDAEVGASFRKGRVLNVRRKVDKGLLAAAMHRPWVRDPVFDQPVILDAGGVPDSGHHCAFVHPATQTRENRHAVTDRLRAAAETAAARCLANEGFSVSLRCTLGHGSVFPTDAGAMAACYGAQMSGQTVFKKGSNTPNRAVFAFVHGRRHQFCPCRFASLWFEPGQCHWGRVARWSSTTEPLVGLGERGGASHTLGFAVLGPVAGMAGPRGHGPDLSVVGCPHPPAPLAKAQTGAHCAAVERSLDPMQHMDLIREITGQGRHRVWTAKLWCQCFRGHTFDRVAIGNNPRHNSADTMGKLSGFLHL